MLRRLWPWLLIFAVSASGTASVVQIPAPGVRPRNLSDRERQLWRTLNRASEFSNVPHVSARASCEENQPPQALATPDPLIPSGDAAKVKVSFIVGADGRVHSPLILESAGPVRDRSVLQTVRHWRYRPATCNGVPTEAEGRIEFSQH
ncbi:MAG: TonB family protein [Candidatus Sulfotelmatobacter sp.]